MQDFLTSTLSIALAAVAGASLLLTLLVRAALHWKLSRPPGAPTMSVVAPISVLKPLKGLDDQLFENLASFAEQTHPQYELILGAEDPKDPALVIARRVAAAHPHRQIQVVSGAPPLGKNPKVSNVSFLARFAKHDLILISDANVRVGPDYLRDAAAHMSASDVGLVHHLIAGVGEETLGALLENLHLSTFIASAVATSERLGHSCVIGKSMLLRRSELEGVGGFASVKDVLAEDYLIGRSIAETGRKIVLASAPIETVNTSWTVRRFCSRHMRWSQMRRRINPMAYLAEPLLNPLVWMFLLSVQALNREVFAWSVAGSLVKIAADALVLRRIRGRSTDVVDLMWIPLKDFLVVALWTVAAFKRTVAWRGHTMSIGPGSTLVADELQEILAHDTAP